MEHECNWGCYVDKFGVDHHSLTPYPIPSVPALASVPSKEK